MRRYVGDFTATSEDKMSKVADEVEIPQSARDSWAEYASCVKIPPLIRLPMNNAYVSGYIAGMKYGQIHNRCEECSESMDCCSCKNGW